jgi:hypothetical protein
VNMDHETPEEMHKIIDSVPEGETWNDPDFYHDPSIIARDFAELGGYDQISIVSTPDPNCIRQGEIGDCYLMASISSLAEYPHRIT